MVPSAWKKSPTVGVARSAVLREGGADMALLPHLPFTPGESLYSYIERIARTHGNMGAVEFLRIIKIAPSGLVVADDIDIQQLSDITGAVPDDLKTGVLIQPDSATVLFRGEPTDKAFFGPGEWGYCPICAQENRDPYGNPVTKVVWQMASVRTCVDHSVFLLPHSVISSAGVSQDFPTVKKAYASKIEDVSPLEDHLRQRAAGASSSGWIDGQQIDVISRVSEIIGAILKFGQYTSMKSLSRCDLFVAGSVGFPFIAGGPAGIRAGLTEILSASRDKNCEPTPTAKFGILYKWLNDRVTQPECVEIAGIVRDFILETMPIDPGAVVLGEKVTVRRVHSIKSLALATGLSRDAVRGSLEGSGLVEAEILNTLPQAVALNSKAAEMAILMSEESLPEDPSDVARALSCSSRVALELLRSGMLCLSAKLSDDTTSAALSGPRNLFSFLSDIYEKADPVATMGDEMSDLWSIAHEFDLPVAALLQLILSERIKCVERVLSESGLQAVKASPREVGKLTTKTDRAEAIFASQAAKIIDAPTSYIDLLSRYPDANGDFLLRRSFRRKGRKVTWLVSLNDVRQFTRDHVSIDEISRSEGRRPTDTFRKLSETGIHPIFAEHKPPAIFYKRAPLT
ncbi:hypothetical protein EEB11_06185 [Pseudotabrizicola sediminis]|uniref:TniQ domain-containing protein n=2 Tax=Pseudotabrizicola sediminis TaxID=2486418 RepID=A0ABY2KNQ6_9RHOB|nr:hypothetical protein EEB11_06185 [Pseudotabrizicola sediminis]